MHQVSKNLELDETARYLEEDLSRDEANNYLYQNEQSSLGGGIITEKKYKMQFTNADGTVEHIEFHSDIRTRKFEPLSSLGSNKVPNSIVSTSKDLQQTLKRRYQYQSGLFNEVILNILHTANLKPIEERIDFKKLNNYLKSEFVNNGLNLPFVFAVINKDGKIVYQNGDIPPVSDVIQQVLFEEMGIYHFDSWAANFGEVTTALELTVEGSGFRFKSRFNKFTNLPELMNIFREVADVQTADMLDLDVPALRGGKPIIVESEPDWYVKQVMEDFVVRAERIRGGGVDPSVDNFLKITHEARLLGTDARLIDKDAPNNPDGKLNKVAENVWKEYEKGNVNGHIGCQLIFSDIGTPG